MVLCWVMEDLKVIKKPFLRTSNSIWGTRAETFPAGSRRGEKALQAATSSQGLRKPRCLLPGKRRSFQPLGLRLSQQPLFIWLYWLHSIPKHAPGSPACSSVAGRDVGLGRPTCSPVPCVRQLRTRWPDFHSGRNYSLSFPSGCGRCLGCFFHRSPKGFPSCWCQQRGRICPLCPQPAPSSGMGMVYWTSLEGFGFTDISSAARDCCF